MLSEFKLETGKIVFELSSEVKLFTRVVRFEDPTRIAPYLSPCYKV